MEEPVGAPLSDHLTRVASTGGLFHTAAPFNLALIKSALRSVPRLRSAVGAISSPGFELVQFCQPGVLERTPLNRRKKKNINTSLLSNFHVCEESLVKAA